MEKGDKVKWGRHKRPFWIHDYKGGEYRIVDSFFDIEDERSNWTESAWVSPKDIKPFNS